MIAIKVAYTDTFFSPLIPPIETVLRLPEHFHLNFHNYTELASEALLHESNKIQLQNVTPVSNEFGASDI